MIVGLQVNPWKLLDSSLKWAAATADVNVEGLPCASLHCPGVVSRSSAHIREGGAAKRGGAKPHDEIPPIETRF